MVNGTIFQNAVFAEVNKLDPKMYRAVINHFIAIMDTDTLSIALTFLRELQNIG